MDTKLILVEGLPGSGKTTTAELILELLKEKGLSSKLFLEGNLQHPADYDSISFFTNQEYAVLLEQYQEIRNDLNALAFERVDGWMVSRYELHKRLGDRELPNTLSKKLSENDIYELPLEKHIELLADNWTRFRDNSMNNNDIYIFECCFIQNPVTIGMVKYGASSEVVMNYVNSLASIIEPLNPVLIYVNQEDLRTSFTKAVQERPKEWFDGFTEYYTKQGYGKRQRAEGLDGTINVLEARAKLEAKIYDSIKFEKYKINNSDFDLLLHKTRIAKSLKEV
ncbi:hypothetical protein SAMN05192533_101408 [Mesobacillus persicus]|uniref:Uncharacterized protein n=1 Tax=Mesobacillus persicus TaxID=930146 RepID=A0A1H7WFY0_9BACI|nr:hypothetical protein [Mesobacillus persicus]SEM20512.1 hypothetical protein SAMN05192533_101408 [Mesobacillus persicus]